MATAIVNSDKDAVVSEIFIAAPPMRVFEALTDPRQVMTWWTSESCQIQKFDLEPRRGGKWVYESAKTRLNVNGVSRFHCEGEIIEYDPPRLLAYTWIANWHDDPGRRTVVRYELTAEEDGTQVKIIHSGLIQEAAAHKDYSGGWAGVLESLKRFIEE